MIVVASANGQIGIQEAMRILKAGGSAIDAVEAGIRLVESNPLDHTVGYGGFPNILGKVELDASIMDGKTLAAGAVGAIRDYEHPISIARKVMEQLPHVLLVGEGAARFADEMAFEKRDLVDEEARRVWEKVLRQEMPEEVFLDLPNRKDLWKWVRITTDPEKTHGTVNLIAQDGAGNICSGVSTSGWANKYPGRLGDSPLIGAGNYAHNRYGAAACTGMGEMAIRACTARSLVLYMKMGLSIEEAGRMAISDLHELEGRFLSRMSIIALDKNGQPAAFSTLEDATFVYMTDDMSEPVTKPRLFFPIHSRWDPL
jgi:beta-aspartyl-peptidase (threonine type)